VDSLFFHGDKTENPGDLGCAIDLGPTGTGFSTMGNAMGNAMEMVISWEKTIGKPWENGDFMGFIDIYS
jgi:hypothetical protein